MDVDLLIQFMLKNHLKVKDDVKEELVQRQEKLQNEDGEFKAHEMSADRLVKSKEESSEEEYGKYEMKVKGEFANDYVDYEKEKLCNHEMEEVNVDGDHFEVEELRDDGLNEDSDSEIEELRVDELNELKENGHGELRVDDSNAVKENGDCKNEKFRSDQLDEVVESLENEIGNSEKVKLSSSDDELSELIEPWEYEDVDKDHRNTDLPLHSTENESESKECDRAEKRIKHYTSSQKILLVGEGDLSFAVCLAKAFRDATNMVATTLDSKAELITKYGNAKGNLEVLKEKRCIILHEVDAHALSRHAMLRNERFDCIVFNFPHASLLYREHDYYQIELHQALVRAFFKSASKLISYTGEIHVTHKTAYPFDRWNITELAEEAGLVLVDEVCFNLWDYPCLGITAGRYVQLHILKHN